MSAPKTAADVRVGDVIQWLGHWVPVIEVSDPFLPGNRGRRQVVAFTLDATEIPNLGKTFTVRYHLDELVAVQ